MFLHSTSRPEVRGQGSLITHCCLWLIAGGTWLRALGRHLNSPLGRLMGCVQYSPRSQRLVWWVPTNTASMLLLKTAQLQCCGSCGDVYKQRRCSAFSSLKCSPWHVEHVSEHILVARCRTVLSWRCAEGGGCIKVPRKVGHPWNVSAAADVSRVATGPCLCISSLCLLASGRLRHFCTRIVCPSLGWYCK